ncbi:MAG: WecB/TagA/CpsF family glycosyltransferase [Treponema sp.]|nr:WecB/TagA/CpsF family glycosyltransferase [Treponema sp.]
MGDKNQPNRERVNLLTVPVDIVASEQLEPLVRELLDQGKEQNIILLSLWDLLRARRSGEYRNYVRKAALVIPISRSIIGGIRFLTGKKATRYMPFDFVVQLLTILESREFSAYLLGGKKKIILKANKNIRQTFPRLRVVGRFPGFFKRQEEAAIIEAIHKASPTLLLVGKGVRGEEHWIARNSARLGGVMRLWCSDLFDVFAERKKHPSRASFDHGLEWIGFCFRNPFRFFRVFAYIYYNLLLLIYKLFVK